MVKRIDSTWVLCNYLHTTRVATRETIYNLRGLQNINDLRSRCVECFVTDIIILLTKFLSPFVCFLQSCNPIFFVTCPRLTITKFFPSCLRLGLGIPFISSPGCSLVAFIENEDDTLAMWM